MHNPPFLRWPSERAIPEKFPNFLFRGRRHHEALMTLIVFGKNDSCEKQAITAEEKVRHEQQW
jgi:hypothetical protein